MSTDSVNITSRSHLGMTFSDVIQTNATFHPQTTCPNSPKPHSNISAVSPSTAALPSLAQAVVCNTVRSGSVLVHPPEPSMLSDCAIGHTLHNIPNSHVNSSVSHSSTVDFSLPVQAATGDTTCPGRVPSLRTDLIRVASSLPDSTISLAQLSKSSNPSQMLSIETPLPRITHGIVEASRQDSIQSKSLKSFPEHSKNFF